MMHKILKNGRIELVVDFLASSLLEHESCFAKDGQVTRDGRPARIEPIRDFPSGPRSAAQHSQDLASCLVCKSVECAV